MHQTVHSDWSNLISRPKLSLYRANLIADLMVILDNSTRWNSTWYLINRALRLKDRIQLFAVRNKRLIKDDDLLDDD
jgi:hypothetical protein